MSTRILSLSAVLLGVTLCVAAGATEVYRHVDKDGVVHYTDQPPTKGAKPAVLPPIQVVGPVGGRPAPGSASGATVITDADLTGAAPLSVSIMSPTPDQTFRRDDRLLPVSVRMNQPLPQGHGLLYLLDGTARNAEPTRSLNFTFAGVERGEHMVAVATVDANGREVARTAPVIVHMESAPLVTQERPPAPARGPTPIP